jgi:hypothetical protein
MDGGTVVLRPYADVHIVQKVMLVVGQRVLLRAFCQRGRVCGGWKGGVERRECIFLNARGGRMRPMQKGL